MNSSSTGARAREAVLTFGPALASLVVVGLAFWFASKFVEPEPPKQLVMATASKGSPYYRAAERYRDYLGKNGIKLELRETSGSFENLSLLKTPGSGVQAGILQGGISNSSNAPGLQSLGRIAYEPVWIFVRDDMSIDRLSSLVGKRILVGPEGGGTYYVSTRLLAASGITPDNSTLIPMELPDYVEALASGKADAGFLVLAPEARTVQRLFAQTGVRLLSLPQADAYAQRFPYLSKIDLMQGIVDFGRNLPAADTALVATKAVLVVRDDIHPALANLLTQAVVAAHAQPVVGPNGEAPILQGSGEFPITTDPEFPMSAEALRVYKSGTPFLQRYLPFWLATLVDRMTVLLLPIVGVLLPALKLGPMAYTWRIRQRLLYWYAELRKVERGVRAGISAEMIAQKRARVEEIAEAVYEIPVPVMFSSQHFDLREHVEVVRRRLQSLEKPGVVA